MAEHLFAIVIVFLLLVIVMCVYTVHQKNMNANELLNEL
jgi:hypothetical protein